ncbi:GntR family transcriptional regulator [Rhodococcus sp. NBC_00297]|uniref:GntR family transcriptional regulator n=1 Tax=Rhodococcus sp. NBC_00297 TaxID=2976005 RepID=UPI002E283C4E|nr:GntR family transcriptional regulator [Rhodococcus sp. NBC_00297]
MSMARDDRIQPQTRTQIVIQRLRDDILSGVMPAGSRIRQVELAKRLGVSTTPVREALTVLEREGLVVLDAYRGAMVLSIRLQDLRENFKIRTRLECLAVEEAARQAGDRDIADLELLLDTMDDVDDPLKYFQLNRDFHARMYESAKMPRLCEVIAQFRDAADVYLRLAAATDDDVAPDMNITRAEHRALVDAIQAREPRRASLIMQSHIQSLGDRLIDSFGQWQKASSDVAMQSGTGPVFTDGDTQVVNSRRALDREPV